ncbi:MAG: heme ABC exporter ATP-binding protein CcmA [Anaerolineae bacterium]|nr:heme ABC exporter ATP-binding protein CcmA [Anaerolineae bacterium]MDW8173485.1 heme ABC exporter ATP-binding protein CcmA [Anaerolineae bacterium]
MSERPIIAIEDLSKSYGYLPVLRKLNLSIARGQFLALLGPNGSGKSTLLRLIPGLTKPSSGTIQVGGWHIPQEAAAVRHQIGLVSHKSLLYDNLTARENLAFFGQLYGLRGAALDARVDHLLERVGLKKRADSLARTFSRGMSQRLSIARALLHDPHVLLFDEPHTGLDQDASAVLDELLRASHGEGHTIIMTTHDLPRAALLAERAIILSRGQIAYDAPTDPAHPQDLVAAFQRVTGETSAR